MGFGPRAHGFWRVGPWLELLGFLLGLGGTAFADGMVVAPEATYAQKIELPDQRAMIHFSGGIERLVIETSFRGQGADFAWIVPLPAAPSIQPASENFFPTLQQAFQPELLGRVRPYYFGVLFFCGLVFLGLRALKDEVSWIKDVPLCLLLAVAAGVMGKHPWVGILILAGAVYMRIMARTPAAVALALVVGACVSMVLTLANHGIRNGVGMVQTLGDEGESGTGQAIAGVKVLATGHAGLFETTTIEGNKPDAILRWLRKNGYHLPASAMPAIQYYVDKRWVFVASRVRRDQDRQTALHPLAFTFPTDQPVYPTRLTAVDNERCAMDLFVFGDRRAAARHFRIVRCERIAGARGATDTGIVLSDPEILGLIGRSTVGTKLSGTLGPEQMATDVAIESRFYRRQGSWVCGGMDALRIALNVALPTGAVGWSLLGLSRGGWSTDKPWVRRWRWRMLAVAVLLGVAVFFLLPIVEVVETYPSGDTF